MLKVDYRYFIEFFCHVIRGIQHSESTDASRKFCRTMANACAEAPFGHDAAVVPASFRARDRARDNRSPVVRVICLCGKHFCMILSRVPSSVAELMGQMRIVAPEGARSLVSKTFLMMLCCLDVDGADGDIVCALPVSEIINGGTSDLRKHYHGIRLRNQLHTSVSDNSSGTIFAHVLISLTRKMELAASLPCITVQRQL